MTEILAQILLENESNLLTEDLTKKDIEKIEALVRKTIKGDVGEKEILRITKNVLVQLFKILYLRRGTVMPAITAASS